MDIVAEIINGTTLVAVSAPHLDANNADEFRHRMEMIMNSAAAVVLDLSGVGVIDSSGLGAILYCMRHLNARNLQLGICGMSRAVQIMFDLARLEKIVHVYPSRDAAIAALHAS